MTMVYGYSSGHLVINCITDEASSLRNGSYDLVVWIVEQ